jgi:cob(I)alamin adenosyltransferase
MVRTFLKHCEEAEEDDELNEVHRELYDVALAVGAPFEAKDWPSYVKIARKKFKKLKQAAALFSEIQPEISSHTNFKMAVQSLNVAVLEIAQILGIPTTE